MSAENSKSSSARGGRRAAGKSSVGVGAGAGDDERTESSEAGVHTCLAPFAWQQDAWQRMVAMRRADKLTHAWLVLGQSGTGRRGFIAAWVASLLCKPPEVTQTQAAPDMFGMVEPVAVASAPARMDGAACGECTSCKAILAGAHPDAHVLSQDGHLGLAATWSLQREDSILHWEPSKDSRRRDIGVEGVRSLIDKLFVASHASGLKIAVVSPAELLNEASANALLKLIEEPPANTVLILIAEQLADLKPTLISRCQRLLLPGPAPEVAQAWMQAQLGTVDLNQQCLALDWARGAPLKALNLLEGEGLEQIAGWQRIMAELTAGRVDPIQAAAAIGKTETDGFLQWWIDCLTTLWRQRVFAIDTSSVRFISGAVPASVESGVFDRALQVAMDARKALDRNANPLLSIESLLIDWRAAIAGAGR